MTFSTLADVRSQIDSIDSELVSLIAQRAECVQAAAAFKTDHAAVRAPERVQQVIDRVREKAAAAVLYPGSWSQWAADSHLPAEIGYRDTAE